MIKRCGWCKNGLKAMDGDTAFVVCALIPPTHVLGTDENGKPKLAWIRPNMSVKGWCGQFGFSLLRWLGYGPRA
jgi:hypothetical protein